MTRPTLAEAVARAHAVANLIERPPSDSVLLDESVANDHAADLRVLLETGRRILELHHSGDGVPHALEEHALAHGRALAAKRDGAQ